MTFQSLPGWLCVTDVLVFGGFFLFELTLTKPILELGKSHALPRNQLPSDDDDISLLFSLSQNFSPHNFLKKWFPSFESYLALKKFFVLFFFRYIYNFCKGYLLTWCSEIDPEMRNFFMSKRSCIQIAIDIETFWAFNGE